MAILTRVLCVFVVKKRNHHEVHGGHGEGTELLYFVPFVFSLCVFVVKKNHHGVHGDHGEGTELLYFVPFVFSLCVFVVKKERGTNNLYSL